MRDAWIFDNHRLLCCTLLTLASAPAAAGEFQAMYQGRPPSSAEQVQGSASVIEYAATTTVRVTFRTPAAGNATLELELPNDDVAIRPTARYWEEVAGGALFISSQVLGTVERTPVGCDCRGGRLALRMISDRGELRSLSYGLYAGSAACVTPVALADDVPLTVRELPCPGAEDPAPGTTRPAANDPPSPPTHAPDVVETEIGCGGTYDPEYDDEGCDAGDGGSGWGDDSGGCESDSGSWGDDSGGCESDSDGWGDDSGGCESDGDSDFASCEGDDWGTAHAALRPGKRRPRRGRSAALPPVGVTLPYILVGLLLTRALRPRRRRRRNAAITSR